MNMDSGRSGLAEALRKRGFVNMRPPADDGSDPDQRTMMLALYDLNGEMIELNMGTPCIDVVSTAPVRLAVSEYDGWLNSLLSGARVHSRRDRARTAVARAFVALVERTDERNLGIENAGFAPARLHEVDYKLRVVARRFFVVMQRLYNAIEKDGYAGVLDLI